MHGVILFGGLVFGCVSGLTLRIMVDGAKFSRKLKSMKGGF